MKKHRNNTNEGLATPRWAHLWAVGYDDPDRAAQVREEIWRLAGPRQYLILLDTAVVVRHADGPFSIDREQHSIINSMVSGGVLGFLTGLVVAAPLAGAAIGALLGCAASTALSSIGIDDKFVQD